MGHAMSGPGRAQRLLGGWSANLLQLLLGITQQVALVPVFLHYCSSELLAAWLALYAAGNLTLVADAGLQLRAINRFLSFKSCVDSDGRTARYYAAMQRVYLGLSGALIVFALAGSYLIRPSHLLGFEAIPDFDISFAVMTAGMLLVLMSNMPAALYRARGQYGRAVWMQCAATLLAQVGQLVAIATTGSLTVIVIAYVAPQILLAGYIAIVDVYRLFPFLHRARAQVPSSWNWTRGQFRRAFPFAIAGSTEIALQNLPVLLVSAIVVDRVAVAQWGLTRVVAGLVRALCVQVALPLAAELGHDHAIGAKQQLRRLYARGSVFLVLLASVVVSGLLAFWRDFFALWTHGVIPYDLPLMLTLLIGAEISAPAMLALGFAYYSDRGELLARTKGMQLAAFLILSVALTPRMGPLGMAIAIVATDLLFQFGLLAVTIIWQTLERPFRHVAFLAVLTVLVSAAGWALGLAIRSAMPGTGLSRFLLECALWLVVMAVAASPLTAKRVRDWLTNVIPA
jgi:hypothetical protein